MSSSDYTLAESLSIVVMVLAILSMSYTAVQVRSLCGRSANFLVGVLALLTFSIVMRGVKRFHTMAHPNNDPDGTVVGLEIIAI